MANGEDRLVCAGRSLIDIAWHAAVQAHGSLMLAAQCQTYSFTTRYGSYNRINTKALYDATIKNCLLSESPCLGR